MKMDKYLARKDPTMARSEFSERLADRLCAEALDTPSITQVANRVGIPISTLYSWLKRGNEGRGRAGRPTRSQRQAPGQ